MVEFVGVTADLQGQRILTSLDFQVEVGETLALLGRSGSGKSTTLRLVNRLIDPTGGEVRVDGVPTTDWDPIVLRRGIGYVIQEVGLFPHLTVARNVATVPLLLGWETGRVRDRVDVLLNRVGLDPGNFRERYPRELSGGERQRVGIARALAAEPPLLLCDEPFGALDPVTRYELQREFRALGRELGTTLLFVTHDVREALFMADRIAFLERGEIRFQGSTDGFRCSDEPAVVRFREAAL